MTRLKLFWNGAIEPGPPTSSQVCGLTVVVISSISESKSACAPPPRPPGPMLIGCVMPETSARQPAGHELIDLGQHGRIDHAAGVGCRSGWRHNAEPGLSPTPVPVML